MCDDSFIHHWWIISHTMIYLIYYICDIRTFMIYSHLQQTQLWPFVSFCICRTCGAHRVYMRVVCVCVCVCCDHTNQTWGSNFNILCRQQFGLSLWFICVCFFLYLNANITPVRGWPIFHWHQSKCGLVVQTGWNS